MTSRNDVIDWSSGKRLFRLRAAGVPLSKDALDRLDDILNRHPEWEFDPTERAEFSIWTGSSVGERGDASSLKGVAPQNLLPLVRSKAAADRFSSDGLWHNFTRDNPALAFEALVAQADAGDVEADEWQQLFFKLREETSNRELDEQVLAYLSRQDLKRFEGAFQSIASWLKDKRSNVETSKGGWERILFVWDRIAEHVSDYAEEGESPGDIENIMSAVWNNTPGILTELLAQRLGDQKLARNSVIPADISVRFDKAIAWPGERGLIAQCSLLQRLPWLEYLVPQWTWANLVPLLEKEDGYWLERWRARFYHRSLGTQKLFERTKPSFLRTFAFFNRRPSDQGQALLLVRAAYKATRSKSAWTLTSAEARDAVGAGGPELMNEILRLLSGRNADDSAEKHWRTVVHPVLNFLWPRDASSQTQRTSRGLIRLFFEAGDAFPKAVDGFVQFVRAWSGDKPWDFEYLFDQAATETLARYPVEAVRLLNVYISGDAIPVKLNEILDAIEHSKPALKTDKDFSMLRGFARRSAA